MAPGMPVELEVLQQWFRAEAKGVAQDAADKAIEKYDGRMKERLKAHADACPGPRLAQLTNRIVWLFAGAVIVTVINIAVSVVRAAR